MVHPECKQDELFFANVPKRYAFDNIPFKTKRLGTLAMSSRGDIISFLNPVFISKEEFETLKKIKQSNN